MTYNTYHPSRGIAYTISLCARHALALALTSKKWIVELFDVNEEKCVECERHHPHRINDDNGKVCAHDL